MKRDRKVGRRTNKFDSQNRLFWAFIFTTFSLKTETQFDAAYARDAERFRLNGSDLPHVKVPYYWVVMALNVVSSIYRGHGLSQTDRERVRVWEVFLPNNVVSKRASKWSEIGRWGRRTNKFDSQNRLFWAFIFTTFSLKTEPQFDAA